MRDIILNYKIYLIEKLFKKFENIVQIDTENWYLLYIFPPIGGK